MYPLQYEIDVMPYTVNAGQYGSGDTMPGRKVRVFSWAVIAGNNIETKEGNAIILSTTERLQIIAPGDTFRTPTPNESLEQVRVKGEKWTLTGTEETHDNGPWWSPGLSVYTFEREVGDYITPPGNDDEDEPAPGDSEVPEAYKYNPYADTNSSYYGQGVGSMGHNFPVDDTYNPYNDDGGPYGDPSPFNGQGGGPFGEEWPEGQSAEARNAYQESLGNVG